MELENHFLSLFDNHHYTMLLQECNDLLKKSDLKPDLFLAHLYIALAMYETAELENIDVLTEILEHIEKAIAFDSSHSQMERAKNLKTLIEFKLSTLK